METGIVEVEGCRLGYCIEGNGPDALVVGSAVYYPRSFSKDLRQHFRLIFIDWRGFCEGQFAPNTSLDTLLDDIEFVRRKLGIEKCMVIGHSAHALLALEYAKKYPAAVSHVVMIGISPSLHPAMGALAEKNWQETASLDRKEALQRRIEQVPDVTLNKLPPSDRFVAWYVRRDPQAWYDDQFNSSWLWENVHTNMPYFDFLYGVALRDIDITRNLEKFHKPVFLALGRYDFIVAPPSCWDPLKFKFNNLTLHIFEKSGHSPQFEEPAAFDKALSEFFISP